MYVCSYGNTYYFCLFLLKILEVITKTLEFHTSTNYQVKVPQPFTSEVHEDILLDLARIKRQKYSSDYDLHVDIFRSLKRLNDGHCSWANYCYVSHDLHLVLTKLTHIHPKGWCVSTK